MESLELRVQGEEKKTDALTGSTKEYLISLLKEVNQDASYSDRTKFTLRRLRTYGREVVVE